jgi:hypothetical protein
MNRFVSCPSVLGANNGEGVLIVVRSFRSFGGRARSRRVSALVALFLATLPVHAGTIATAGATLLGSGVSPSCDQISRGTEVGCNLNSPGGIASAFSSASAGFGVLSVSAGAGTFNNNNWQAIGEGISSFSSKLAFWQTGVITGTWFVSYTEAGDIAGAPPGSLAIMGTLVPFPNCGVGNDCGGGFFIPVTFMSSGGPIDVSAIAQVVDDTPGSEYSSISVQLVGFSSDYTILADAPEPGTFGLTGIALLLVLPFIRRLRRQRFPGWTGSVPAYRSHRTVPEL